MWKMKTKVVNREKLIKLPLIDIYLLPSEIAQISVFIDDKLGPRVVIMTTRSAYHIINCDDAETARAIAEEVAVS